MTENEGVGQGSEKAFIVHKETKHCYHDLFTGRWHQAFLCDVMSWDFGVGGVGGGRRGYNEDWDEQLPLPTQAEGSVFPGDMVV